MKIVANNVTLECEDNIFNNDMATNNLLKVVNNIIGAAVNMPMEINIKDKIQTSTKSYNVGEKLDRERLPNSEKSGKKFNNVVDLKDLDIKNPKNVNYFRCPHCGQSIVINIDDKNYIRDIYNGIIYEVEIDEDTQLKTSDDYRQLLASAKKNETITICDTDEVNGYCIKCGIDHTLSDYIEAYENPEAYFEHDKICPLCGEEVCENVNGHESIYKCEKCDYEEEVENA